MTFNANTARRFKETVERLANMNLGEDLRGYYDGYVAPDFMCAAASERRQGS